MMRATNSASFEEHDFDFDEVDEKMSGFAACF
jgi:hypothetical protein